jgi:hypothetical protein
MKMQGCDCSKKKKQGEERFSRQDQEIRSFGSGNIDEFKAETSWGSRECSNEK